MGNRGTAWGAFTSAVAVGAIVSGALIPASLLERSPAGAWKPAREAGALVRAIGASASAAPLCDAGIARVERLPYSFTEERSPEWRCFGRVAHTTVDLVTRCDGSRFFLPPSSLDDARCPAAPSCAFDPSDPDSPPLSWFANGNSNNCHSSGVSVDFCCVSTPPEGHRVVCEGESACPPPPPPCCKKNDCSDCFLRPISIPHGEVSTDWPVFPLGEAGFPSQFSVIWRGKATARIGNVAEPLGPRAMHSFSLFLWKSADRERALVTSEDGYVVPFSWDHAWDGITRPSPWTPIGARHATLTESLCPQVAQFRQDDGTTIQFHEYCDGSDPLEGTPIRLVRPNGDSLDFVYTGDGRLLSVSNRRGAQVLFTYLGADFPDPTLAGSGILQKVTAPDGREYEFVLDRGVLAEIRGPEGPLWTMEVAPGTAGLEEVRDAEGNLDSRWDYASDDGLTPTSESGPGEMVGNNRVEVTLVSPSTVELRFTPAGATTEVTNTYSFASEGDALPHVVGRTVSGTCPNCGTADFARAFWPGTNDVRALEDGQGRLTVYQDWAADPGGAQHALAYDDDGHPLVVYQGCAGSVGAPDCSTGRRMEYRYQPGTDVVAVSTRPSAVPGSVAAEERQFDGASTRVLLARSIGHTASALDGALAGAPVTRTTLTTYGGGAGGLDVTRVEGPFEGVTPPADAPRTDFDYYAPGDPDACDGTNIAADAFRLRRVSRFVNGGGRTLDTFYGAYDGSGRPGCTRNPDGTETRLFYDFRGNVTRTIVDAGGLSLVTDSVYDANGNLVALLLPRSTPNGTTGFSYRYDDADRLVELSQGFYPSGGGPLVPLQSMAYFFDAWGNKTGSEYRDSTGATITSEGSVYDRFGRLAELARPAGDSSRRTAFGYDEEGELTGVTDAQGDTVLYGSVEDPSRFDRFGKLSLVQQQVCDRPATDPDAPCFPHVSDVRYRYDAALQLEEVAVQDTVRGGTMRTGYVTDDFGQVVKVESPDSGIATYRYDGAGRLVESRDSRGKVFRFEYDRLHRITRKVNASPVTVVAEDAGNGTATVNEDGTVTYRPNENYAGPDSFNYTVNGRNGDVSSGTVSVTVNPINDPPVAQFKTTAGVVGRQVEFVIRAEDVDHCELSFSVVSGPSRGDIDSFALLPCTAGVITNRDEVRVTYTGTSVGFDELVFAVSDGQSSSQATVVLVVTEEGAALLGVSTEAHSTLGPDVSETLQDGACTMAPCALESYSESVGTSSGSFAFARASRGSLAAKSGGTALTGSTPGDASFASRGSGFFVLPDLVFSGPDSQVCPDGMNLSLNGTLAAALSGAGGTIRAGVAIRVNIGGTSEFTGTLVSDGVTVIGTGLLQGVLLTENLVLTTPGFCVPTGELVPLTLELTTSVDAELFGADLSADSLSDYSNTFSFPDTGPVFELPPGAGADSESGGIADNVWIAPIQSVAVDVKPLNPENVIPCHNEDALNPVALLTTPDFDALTADADTVRFEGGAELHRDANGRAKRHAEDADGDGDLDLVFHVRLSDTGLGCASRVGSLTGATTSGTFFVGSDLLTMKQGGGP